MTAAENTASWWHDMAMQFADHGDYCRKRGREADSIEAFMYALTCERRAASMESTQPGRGIMLRSAAWLAIDARVPALGLELAQEGLASDPPERLRHELLEAMEAATAAALLPEPPEMAAVRERLDREIEHIKRRQAHEVTL